VKLRDVLAHRLRLVPAEVGRRFNADKLHFACPSGHELVTDGHARTAVTDDGRLAWTVGDDRPESTASTTASTTTTNSSTTTSAAT
jgi:hypothetical protein